MSSGETGKKPESETTESKSAGSYLDQALTAEAWQNALIAGAVLAIGGGLLRLAVLPIQAIWEPVTKGQPRTYNARLSKAWDRLTTKHNTRILPEIFSIALALFFGGLVIDWLSLASGFTQKYCCDYHKDKDCKKK